MHLLRLSDGRPHPLAPVDPTVFHVGYEEGKTIKKLITLISEHRLVVVVVFHKTGNWQDRGGILAWDWRNGNKVLVSVSNFTPSKLTSELICWNKKTSGFCPTEAQIIDGHRILGIVESSKDSDEQLLVFWDMSGPQPRQWVLEMPSNKLDIVYEPERLMNSASLQSGVGLHRADPNQRIVGVVCQGSYSDIRLDDDYMIVISTAVLCTLVSTQGAGVQRIHWEKWQPSVTIVRINLAITTVARASGSRFFAVVRGLSYTEYATLMRIYDFSPGARGRRHPNRPPVRDLIVNAGRVVKQVGTASWDFSEDNLLMFHVSVG